ncbi:PREDICTED: Fanconi anemia group D2 protein homolog isoform X2 [Tarenaya hassleriana]|uniref:Fanconi anemia group D2 protein homolog isoform X2 n=1 Tax=Tarenaya hassleriana TaxID=28532 RepID=UPI00053C5D63|nr:PREDICTED: Fanconi anemia group D2 protein homolog isoform X2 [Tarenaya hassleriana]
MVFLSRKRPPAPPPSSAAPPPKFLSQPENEPDAVEKMTAILAEAGCTLINPSGPPYLPSDILAFRRHLTHRFSSCSVATVDRDNAAALRSVFIAGFSSYVRSPINLRRVLSSSSAGKRNESLVRNLLLVSPIQLDLQEFMLEKLPEYFDVIPESSLEEDVARLIISHFRWLDFIVEPDAFTDKLMQVLSICPLHLKKEIIGSLPEIIGDGNSRVVVDSLERMLQEDSAIVVPVLDSFSNLNLDDQLQEQAITVALSCIRTIDAEHVPYLLRFLLLAATPTNVRRIISQIREQLRFTTRLSKPCATQSKLKGKLPVDNCEGSILHALRSSLRFKNILCQEIIKELNGLEKPRDFKVIDIWLLILMYMNGEPIQRSIEKIFKKKIVEGCIQEAMLDQCIWGNKEFVQDYFAPFLSLAEHLLSCKEEKARKIGTHIYTRLFEEFVDNYSRQEVLGSLVTHVGSDNKFEISSGLEVMTILAKKYAQQMLPFSSHINGVLDYLEGFTVENLHKVYEVFSCLALSARTNADSFRSSISNELMMIVRKQVSHADLKYKKMGLVGTLRIVSSLGDVNGVPDSSSQVSDCREVLELLKNALDSCKQCSLARILFYDELAGILGHKILQPEIMEWIGKHLGEFESLFLSDLDNGKLRGNESYSGLEGDVWMNLDGDISPICLNILALASSSSTESCSSLQILPSNFLLLSTVERLTNGGSLAGIDALLGCPLHLPSWKYVCAAVWQSLTGKQREIICLSLYYAANWIRELLNAFCTQIVERSQCISQATEKDVITKLLKRLKNLVFLESLLSSLIKLSPQSLPELHLYLEHSGSLAIPQPKQAEHLGKKPEKRKLHDDASQSTGKKKNGKGPKHSDTNDKLRQPTILDMWKKAGAVTSQTEPDESCCVESSNGKTLGSVDEHCSNPKESLVVEIPQVSQALEAQRLKFRPLLPQCLSILKLPKVVSKDICSPDHRVELPLYLYILRDLHSKLDCVVPPCKQLPSRWANTPSTFWGFRLDELLSQVKELFPSLRLVLDRAVSLLVNGDEISQQIWKKEFTAAMNPNISNVVVSDSLVHTMVSKEVLYCFNKMLLLPVFQTDKSLQLNLLEAFQSTDMPTTSFPDIQPLPSPGTTEYLYLGVYSFFEEILNTACPFSFELALECLITLQLFVTYAQRNLVKVSDEATKKRNLGHIPSLVSSLHARLGTSAEKLLKHKWVDESSENKGLKNRGEMIQNILRIYLEASESTSDLLNELACTVLPQVSLSKSGGGDAHPEFPTLCPVTFLGWYRVLHEENLVLLNKLVKTICSEKRRACEPEAAETHLKNIHKSVNVVVSLVNLCRSHEKVAVHSMAVKYGGKFVDSFLKVFYLLEALFQVHSELVIQLVKDLQKATRTLQTLCSEAKGLKRTAITSKIPATKRSLERFLFHVKALIHTTSLGSAFWMGNLKHKDLTGQVVSSQAYVDNQPNESMPEADPAED